MLRAIGIAISAIPFLFGALRAISTGMRDLRYLAIAVACHIAAVMLLVSGRAGDRTGARLLALAALACVTATALGFGVGWLLGARNFASMLLVTGGFSACAVAGTILLQFRRPRA